MCISLLYNLYCIIIIVDALIEVYVMFQMDTVELILAIILYSLLISTMNLML